MKYVFGLRYENNARAPLWCTRWTSGNRILESWNCLTCGRLHLLAAIGSTLMICNRDKKIFLLFHIDWGWGGAMVMVDEMK